LKGGIEMRLFRISILILLLFSNCSSDVDVQTEKTHTIEIKDGVKYIQNHVQLWGDEPKVALEFVRKIGGLDVMDENYQFFKPYDWTVDANGNLYILDSGNYRIQKFDLDVKFIATFGRKGLGPSEFRQPLFLSIDPQGNMYVQEMPYSKTKSIIVLNSTGKELHRFAIANTYVNETLFLKSGNIVRAFNKPEDIYAPLFGVFDSTGKFLRSFGKKKDFGNDNENQNRNAVVFTIDSNDNIYVAFKSQNRVEKYSSDGTLIWIADRPLDYKIKIYKEIRKEQLPEPHEYVQVTATTVSERICVDNEGRVWVATLNREITPEDKNKNRDELLQDIGEILVADIFDNDGIFLGRLKNIPYIFSSKIFGNRVIMEDMADMAFLEYKIVEK